MKTREIHKPRRADGGPSHETELHRGVCASHPTKLSNPPPLRGWWTCDDPNPRAFARGYLPSPRRGWWTELTGGGGEDVYSSGLYAQEAIRSPQRHRFLTGRHTARNLQVCQAGSLAASIGGLTARRRRYGSVMGDGYRLCHLLWALLLGLSGGCADPGPAISRWSLQASPRPYETDIPLPVGFRLADQSSEDWVGGSVRYLRHRYVGRALRTAVRRFYREQMPLVRWIAESDGIVQGTATLRFHRGSEVCTVIVSSGSPDRVGRVTIEVLITPRFTKAVESASPPSRKTP